MRDTVARLVNALDEFDDGSPIFVNIHGHLHKIAYVEGQVGYTEILLLDESNLGPACARQTEEQSKDVSLSMPDPSPEVTRIMVIRWKLGTASPEEARLVEDWLAEQAILNQSRD